MGKNRKSSRKTRLASGQSVPVELKLVLASQQLDRESAEHHGKSSKRQRDDYVQSPAFHPHDDVDAELRDYLHDYPEGATAFLNRGNYVETLNTANDPGIVLQRSCNVCNLPDSSDNNEFVLCDNQQCTIGGGHLVCLGFSSVPKLQWFCGLCLKDATCGECYLKPRADDPLISCCHCLLVGHSTCMSKREGNAGDVDVREWATSNWHCSKCVCERCYGQPTEEDDLLPCQDCKRLWHLKCLGSGFTSDFVCLICQGAKEEECAVDEAVKAAQTILTNADDIRLNMLSTSTETQSMSSAPFPMTTTTTSFTRSSASIPNSSSEYLQYLAWLNRLKYLRERNRTAFYFVSEFIRHRTPFTEESWRRFVDAAILGDEAKMRLFEALKPPQNLSRFIDTLIPVTVHEELLVHELAGTGVVIEGKFLYRSLTEVLGQLILSPSNVSCIPWHRVLDKLDCKAKSAFGLRLVELTKQFCSKRAIDDTHDIVLPLQVYSDGTSTNFMSLHPMIVSIFTFDRSGRVLNMKTAQVVYGMMPTATTLTYKLKGKIVSAGTVKRLLPTFTPTSVLRVFQRQSVAHFMKQLHRLEEGVIISHPVSRTEKRLHAFLTSYVCDMEERRNILNLSMQKHWVCCQCFGRPLPDSAPCPVEGLESLITGCAPRSFANVKQVLSVNVEEHQLVGKEKWELEHRFGIKRGYTCPVSDDNNFIVGGAASYFLCDRLHVLDGIIIRLWEMLSKHVYTATSLESVTSGLGNISYGVAKDFHFHKMEEALRDFQYLVLALLVENSGIVLSKTWKIPHDRSISHLRLVSSFLRTAIILKDDAPGLLEDELRRSIAVFDTELKTLLNDLQDKFDVTAKMHELIHHFLPQVLENGPASGFSSDIGEWTHALNKQHVHTGSRRHHDQARTVLKRNLHVTLEHDVSEGVTQFSGDRFRPFLAESRVRVKGLVSRPTLDGGATALAMETINALSTNGLLCGLEIVDLASELDRAAKKFWLQLCVNFGKSIECSLMCKRRNTRIKNDMTASVMSAATAPRDYRVIAYRSDSTRVTAPPEVCCRHHDLSCELHCSFARLRHGTAFAFPLVFLEFSDGVACALVLKLEKGLVRGDAITDEIVSNVKFTRQGDRFDLVALQPRLRTSCLVVNVSSKLYVFSAGERAFGHLQ